MMSATVAFSVGRSGSGGTAAAGVGCVRKNLIAVGPVRKHDSVSEQRIIPITADSVTRGTGLDAVEKAKKHFLLRPLRFVRAGIRD